MHRHQWLDQIYVQFMQTQLDYHNFSVRHCQPLEKFIRRFAKYSNLMGSGSGGERSTYNTPNDRNHNNSNHHNLVNASNSLNSDPSLRRTSLVSHGSSTMSPPPHSNPNLSGGGGGGIPMPFNTKSVPPPETDHSHSNSHSNNTHGMNHNMSNHVLKLGHATSPTHVIRHQYPQGHTHNSRTGSYGS